MAASGGEWEPDQPATLLHLETADDWGALAQRYSPNLSPGPLLRCLEVAEELGATSVIIEYRYHDADYRSEYSAFFAKVFPSVHDTAHRLLFFTETLDAEALTDLPEDPGFVGYVTIRPTALGRVGRTMLAPPPGLTDAVLTTVQDEVHVFGRRLTVTGVPFIQQDRQLGVCAHAASWMCHRIQALGGAVARRASADFSTHADRTTARGRMVPSTGLTATQIAGLLRDFGLPPIWYLMGEMPEANPDAPPTVPPELPEDESGRKIEIKPGRWDTRAISVACRHLNSGFAVLVGTLDHAFILCGYRRVVNDDPDDKDFIQFVRHDDQHGPYLVVGEITDDYDPTTDTYYDAWELFLVPVPDDLWLQPENAELRARKRLAELSAWATDNSATITTDAMDELRGIDQLSMRTYATTASDYKASLAARGLDPTLVHEVAFASLSRIVWVVEAIDRRARRTGQPCVVGEAVYDCTSADDDPSVLAIWINGIAWLAQVAGQPRGPFLYNASVATSGCRFQP